MGIARYINKIEPSAQEQIKLHYINIANDKKVIVITVLSGKHVPYTYEGRAFYRNLSSTSRMSQHHYEQLLVKRGQLNYSWEELDVVDYSVSDLDQDEIKLAVRQGIAVNRVSVDAQSDSIQDILVRWNLFHNGKLNNAAVVLFAKKTMPHYSQCHIKLGRFIGTNMLGGLLDNQEFFCNAFNMLNEANNFIRRHLPIASFFEHESFLRIDKPTLPALAIREALVNAICHRDYANRSTSITLAIFDDRLEIWNNGTLPPGLKLDDLKVIHKSMPPNKIISKVFYDRKFFDGWGTGTTKMIDICREADVPDPVFKEYSGGIEITFPFRELIGASNQRDVLPLMLNARQTAILAIIGKGHGVTIQLIMAELVNPPSRRMVQKDLKFLNTHSVIKMEGGGKYVKWVLA